MAKSLYEEHGENAVPILQGMMQAQVKLPKGFAVKNNGNHYIIEKNGKTMRVGLFCAREVFDALNLFS